MIENIDQELMDWMDANLLDYTIEGDSVIIIGDRRYAYVAPDPETDIIFSKEMKFLIGGDPVLALDCEYCIYEFGGNYYYTYYEGNIEFNILKYIGKAVTNVDKPYAHLGIHGGYELYNGSGKYEEWVAKAKFLGCKAVAICEKNTLAGVIAFQQECKGIAPIIGETVTVRGVKELTGEEYKYDVKLYVANIDGWRNLLSINQKINIGEVGSVGYIDYSDLTDLSEGLVLVLPCAFEDMGAKYINNILKAGFVDVYYQLDSVVWESRDRDEAWLKNIRSYIRGNAIGHIPPVLINDSYYIDQEYNFIKKKLNELAGSFYETSYNQHFKSLDESCSIFMELFDEDDDSFTAILTEAIDNTIKISETCRFTIESGKIYAPKFDINGAPVEIPSDIKDNQDLFWYLVEEGINKLNLSDEDYETYTARIKREVDVIIAGGFIDYFLILWDIITWARKNNILVGIGRGSAGGSLISYLLGITNLDPIRYNLLFERFLNEGRIGRALPDIDTDFEGMRRDDVKRYMESRYGVNHVCSVGTYSKFRLRAALKEFRNSSLPHSYINFLSKMVEDREGDWDEVFRTAQSKAPFKDFVKKNVDTINTLRIVMEQPANNSISAASTIIVPKEDSEGNPMDIYRWIPLRKQDGVLISEWEGVYLEAAGFMKEDVLGVRQLDKFRFMIDMIKLGSGEEVDIYKVSLDDPNVYELFCRGCTEDSFHFGSSGLKKMSEEMAPTCIDDLIDLIALYRPGAMESGSHNRYLKRRFSEEEPDFDFGLEEVTSSTYGLIIYQEQVMEATRVLGGFSLTEADDIRKAMGKKKIEVIKPYRDRFINNAVNNKGCNAETAKMIWEKLEVFAGYGFNKSHAAAYAITGYISMWFKAHYPVAFWSAAFEYYKEDADIIRYISEIRTLESGKEGSIVTICPPDINDSGLKFVADYNGRKIIWSLTGISDVGEVASNVLIEERNKHGKFYSMKDLFDRVPRKKVNKKIIDNLIVSGSLDSLYDIKEPKDRIKIFREYVGISGIKYESYGFVDNLICHNFWWEIQQRKVVGFGSIDYRSLINAMGVNVIGSFVDFPKIRRSKSGMKSAHTAGIIMDVDHHKTKKTGTEFANVLVEQNGELLWITIWSASWSVYGKTILESKGRILVLDGCVKFSKFRNCNVFETLDDSVIKLFSL